MVMFSILMCILNYMCTHVPLYIHFSLYIVMCTGVCTCYVYIDTVDSYFFYLLKLSYFYLLLFFNLLPFCSEKSQFFFFFFINITNGMNFQIKEAYLIFQLFNMLSLNMKNKINSICLSTKKKLQPKLFCITCSSTHSSL